MTDLYKQIEALILERNAFEADNLALVNALDNLIDGAFPWSDMGHCNYCNGVSHKKDCDYTAAIELLAKIRGNNG